MKDIYEVWIDDEINEIILAVCKQCIISIPLPLAVVVETVLQFLFPISVDR